MEKFTPPVKKRRNGNYTPEKRPAKKPATNYPRKNPRFLLLTCDPRKNPRPATIRLSFQIYVTTLYIFWQLFSNFLHFTQELFAFYAATFQKFTSTIGQCLALVSSCQTFISTALSNCAWNSSKKFYHRYQFSVRAALVSAFVATTGFFLLLVDSNQAFHSTTTLAGSFFSVDFAAGVSGKQ